MILNGANDKLQIVTGAASALKCAVSWIEADVTSSPVTDITDVDRTPTASITTATTTDLLTCSANRARRVKEASFFNDHASAANPITIQHTDGSIVTPKWRGILLAGEALYYSEEGGWDHKDSNGTSYLQVLNPALKVKALPADQSNSTTTLTEVTGLTVPLAPGVYSFQYNLIYQAGATTTGVRFSVNFDGTVSAFVANERWVTAADASGTAINAPDQDVVTTNAGVAGNFAARAKSTTGWGTTISVDSANADMLMIIEGVMVVTVAGNLELWHGSEVAAASIVKAGSSLYVVKTA